MGKYDLKIKRLDNGKTYEYPTLLFNLKSKKVENSDNAYEIIESPFINNFYKYGDAVPLMPFLEISNKNATIPLEINNKQITVRIQKNSSLDFYEMTMQNKALALSAPENIGTDSAWGIYHSRLGTVIGYNYYDKKYYCMGGIIAITPNKNADPINNNHWRIDFKPYYGGEYYTKGKTVYNSQDLKKGELTKTWCTLDTGKLGINWYGWQFNGHSNSLFGEWLNSNAPKPPEYPYDSDNEDEPGPPIPGLGDGSSDPIPDPSPKPIIDVTNTGFIVIYNPTTLEIAQLAHFMWSGEFVDIIKKMFAEPFAALISLKILYSDVPTGASQTVWLGNVETNVTMKKVTDQFIDMDMGTIHVNEYFGSFADYAPFTKVSIYLPFIGYKDLNVDEVMNADIHLIYRIDVYSGACIAFISASKSIKSTQLNSILYQFDGNCAMEIPFTSNDNSRYVSAILNSVASSAIAVARTSSFTMPQSGQGFNDKGSPAKLNIGSLAPVANGMLDIIGAKPNVQRAGSLAGAISSMGMKQPYLIIHRPISQMPSDYKHYMGIPLNLSRQLSTVKGYTIVSQIFLSSQTATDDEITMITELLKSGVIL